MDARRLLGARTGVARYIQCLLAEWQRMALPFDEVRVFSPRPLPADAVPRDPRFRNVVLPPDLPGLAWEQLVLPLGARGVDVLFSTADTVPVLRRGRRAVFKHAYSPEMAASFGRWERAKRVPFMRYAARRADLVLAPSETILCTTEAGLGVAIARARVRLTPLAAEERFRPRDSRDPTALEVRRRHGVADRPYVLFVGKLSRRRHIPELIEAFGDLRDRVPHALVLAGPNPLGLDVSGMVRRLDLEGRIVHSGFVPDEDLPWLYAGAELFVLASEGEGFSLTTLEAMQSGVPVITLDRPNLAEVTAGAAMLIPDGSRGSLRAAIARLVADHEARADLRRRGLERTRELTWARTARATMDALWELAAR